MARQQHGRIESFQVLDRTLYLIMLASRKMEATDNSMKGHGTAHQVHCMSGCVNNACVATCCEYYYSFAYVSSGKN